ncbi:MAG: dipeptide epimerase [Phycisphaerales bacterium]|nr:dipeptide epimerase [Phycisphaerales bacterium]
MKLTWDHLSLKQASVFRTAKATRTDKQTLWVRLVHDGVVGWGEAAPMDTYGQSLASAEATLGKVAPMLDGDPLAVEKIVGVLLERFDDQRATVAAVDAALHDWIGKRFDLPVSKWLGFDPREIPLTSYTIGIDEPDKIAEKVDQAADFPILKVKVGTPADEATLAMIRKIAPNKTIRVDANAAWSVAEALERIPRLMEFDIEFMEQPIPAGDRDGLRALKEAGFCPIVADESCVRPADVVALAGCVDGVNIKLAKCGGIREAIRMIHLARGFGFKIMLGCMIESSLGIAAAAQLAPLVDWLDLDGHLLLAEDPFQGLGGQKGRLCIGQQPGLGVQPG